MRITVKAIIEYNNKILILRDRNGNYDLPGGGLEKSETLEQACLRELLEETSYKNFEVIELLDESYDYYTMKNPDWKSNMSCYIVRLVDLENGTKLEKDTSEEWVIKDALLSNFENRNTSRHNAMKNCIKDYLRKTNY